MTWQKENATILRNWWMVARKGFLGRSKVRNEFWSDDDDDHDDVYYYYTIIIIIIIIIIHKILYLLNFNRPKHIFTFNILWKCIGRFDIISWNEYRYYI